MSESTNQQERAAAAWSRAAASYSHTGPEFLQCFGKELVDFGQVPPDAKVLDVATGRGAVLFPAARQAGPQGEVIGVDYAEGMVDATRAELQARGVKNATVRQMDAEKLDFPDQTFDRVFCSFALFFFPHPDQALSEFRRVLKPGGKLVLSTWGEHDSRWDWLGELGKLFGLPEEEETPAFDTPEMLSAALRQAGFEDIELQERSREVFYASPEEWWETQWSHGARLHLEQVHPQKLEEGRAFATQKMTEFQQVEGIPILLQVLFASGRRK